MGFDAVQRPDSWSLSTLPTPAKFDRPFDLTGPLAGVPHLHRCSLRTLHGPGGRAATKPPRAIASRCLHSPSRTPRLSPRSLGSRSPMPAPSAHLSMRAHKDGPVSDPRADLQLFFVQCFQAPAHTLAPVQPRLTAQSRARRDEVEGRVFFPSRAPAPPAPNRHAHSPRTTPPPSALPSLAPSLLRSLPPSLPDKALGCRITPRAHENLNIPSTRRTSVPRKTSQVACVQNRKIVVI